ncbi:hypothetical protein LMG27952_05417 [Paraburkholderia hiiakae]|uniref:Uncharacterized protein n=1 Tax=Paraburkholderia hiiakae TaxID=1081782 RepID=A0ABN7I8Q7_9BURK|nr:hypothetical protein LMG27952_05417 [Paraburkholderia hiiakae]
MGRSELLELIRPGCESDREAGYVVALLNA